MDIERKLLSLEEKYTPNKMIPGYSECVKDIKKTLEFIKSLDWIKDFEIHESVENSKRTKTMFNNKQYNYSKLIKEYAQALFDIQFNRVVMNSRQGCELNNFINEFDSNYPELTKYVKSVGIENVLGYTGNSITLSAKPISKHFDFDTAKAISKIANQINQYRQNKLIADAIQSEFKAGEVIVSTDIKDRLLSAFTKHGITDVTPKRNQFELVFDVRITNTKNGSAIKLQQKH